MSLISCLNCPSFGSAPARAEGLNPWSASSQELMGSEGSANQETDKHGELQLTWQGLHSTGEGCAGRRLPMTRSPKALRYLSSSSSTGEFFLLGSSLSWTYPSPELISAGKLVSLHTPQLQGRGWRLQEHYFQIVFPSSKQLVFNQLTPKGQVSADERTSLHTHTPLFPCFRPHSLTLV